MTERRYCPQGDGLQDVVDEFHTGEQTARGETYSIVRELACGHYLQGPDTVITEAPGAPWAGPDRVTAATARPRDLRAAAARQAVLNDPWGEGR